MQTDVRQYANLMKDAGFSDSDIGKPVIECPLSSKGAGSILAYQCNRTQASFFHFTGPPAH
jgi:hypothetical protein